MIRPPRATPRTTEGRARRKAEWLQWAAATREPLGRDYDACYEAGDGDAVARRFAALWLDDPRIRAACRDRFARRYLSRASLAREVRTLRAARRATLELFA